MAFKDFLDEIDASVETILDSSFTIEVYDTITVPRFDDSLLTFDNVDKKVKKCRRLESCVLYVDIRNSASISSDTHPRKLSRLYSAFIRSMIKAAKYYGGHVRNVIGDRVMVIFDQENCFKNAVNTSVLMNSIAKYIIDKHYEDSFSCGIGIDYGKMIVTKAGEIRRGEETEFYRSLVWLGKPANVASRLTDLANKTVVISESNPRVGFQYSDGGEIYWVDESYFSFLEKLEMSYPKMIKYKDDYFSMFYHSKVPTVKHHSPILMTEAVFNGFKKQCPDDLTIVNEWWTKKDVEIKEHSGKIYGGDIIFTDVKDL